MVNVVIVVVVVVICCCYRRFLGTAGWSADWSAGGLVARLTPRLVCADAVPSSSCH